jgi:ABC-type antimicrobial peptide transport system permease subunit
MNVPLLRGRTFDSRDGPDAPHVALVSAALATAKWPNEDPIGKIIQFGNMDGDLRPFTVIGIVGDLRQWSLALTPRPTFYAFVRQRPVAAGRLNIVMATVGDRTPVIAAAQRVVRDLRPDIPARLRTIETIVAESVADRRFVLFVVGVFGGSALLLATLGVYSVISYLVAQRSREISIRVALGAQKHEVIRLVLRQGALVALVGIAAGAAASLGLTRLLGTLLYEVSPTDPAAFVMMVALLTLVALLASWLPARRAARVDVMDILRGG